MYPNRSPSACVGVAFVAGLTVVWLSTLPIFDVGAAVAGGTDGYLGGTAHWGVVAGLLLPRLGRRGATDGPVDDRTAQSRGRTVDARPSASATRTIVSTATSGETEIESIPASTRKST